MSKNTLLITVIFFTSFLPFSTFGFRGTVGGDDENLVGPFPLELSGTVTIDVTIRATQSDMDQGRYFVEISYNQEIDFIELNFPFKPFISDMRLHCLTPYIPNEMGTVTYHTEDTIGYSFKTTSSQVFGYIITPKEGYFGSGFCDSNIGVWDTYMMIDWNLFNQADVVRLNLEVPIDMITYAPYTKQVGQDNNYILKNSKENLSYIGEVFKGPVVWGKNFSYKSSKAYGQHTFNLLAYDSDISNSGPFVESAFSTLMNIFIDIEKILAPSTIVLLLKDQGTGQSGNNFGAVTEGIGGFYNPSWGETNYLSSFSPLGFSPEAHNLTHATINIAGIPWLAEGPAVYSETRLPEDLNLITHKERLDQLKIKHDEYIIARAKGHDYVLNQDPWSEVNGSFTIYQKGCLVVYLIDTLIQSHSNGKDIYDLWNAYFQFVESQSANLNWNPWDRDMIYTKIIEIAESFTDIDFDTFFSLYVKDNQLLPMRWNSEKSDFDILYPPGRPMQFQPCRPMPWLPLLLLGN